MKSQSIAIAFFVALISMNIQAHSGRTDSSGCHTDSSTGIRHCHNSTTTPSTPTRFTLTVATTGTGSGTVSGGGTFNSGTNVTPVAIPDSNSTFIGWVASSCGSTFRLTFSRTCIAEFALKPTPEPTPVDPTPVDPTPVDPTPVDPAPVDPAPVDPTSTEVNASNQCAEYNIEDSTIYLPCIDVNGTTYSGEMTLIPSIFQLQFNMKKFVLAPQSISEQCAVLPTGENAKIKINCIQIGGDKFKVEMQPEYSLTSFERLD